MERPLYAEETVVRRPVSPPAEDATAQVQGRGTAPDPERGRKVLLIVTGVFTGIVLVSGIALAAVFLTRQGGNDDKAARAVEQSKTPTASSSRKTATSPKPTSTSRVPGTEASSPATTAPRNTPSTGDVRNLSAGLFCRDLSARGFSYSAAVDYWRVNGQPNQMDADRNGIPCETVYQASDVTAYWSVRDLPNDSFGSGALPGGLFCRDLRARGLSYSDAVSYWWSEGGPDRMDADGNSIPCETVYPAVEVSAFWF